eukprot:TRINITY_DN14834_c0_g1_i1.p1 TRINITY_DN14834_c0_g1~~TRINITY_DN14834_c0_g1_i1.p1  ORF type:complete len:404 (+),score=106.66 TRINITY_DN14834_c0_g1_i1:29-1213(+)
MEEFNMKMRKSISLEHIPFQPNQDTQDSKRGATTRDGEVIEEGKEEIKSILKGPGKGKAKKDVAMKFNFTEEEKVKLEDTSRPRLKRKGTIWIPPEAAEEAHRLVLESEKKEGLASPTLDPSPHPPSDTTPEPLQDSDKTPKWRKSKSLNDDLNRKSLLSRSPPTNHRPIWSPAEPTKEKTDEQRSRRKSYKSNRSRTTNKKSIEKVTNNAQKHNLEVVKGKINTIFSPHRQSNAPAVKKSEVTLNLNVALPSECSVHFPQGSGSVVSPHVHSPTSPRASSNPFSRGTIQNPHALPKATDHVSPRPSMVRSPSSLSPRNVEKKEIEHKTSEKEVSLKKISLHEPLDLGGEKERKEPGSEREHGTLRLSGKTKRKNSGTIFRGNAVGSYREPMED